MKISRLTRDYVVTTKIIRQSALTPDCWMIQFWGLEACNRCEYKGILECGGVAVIKKIEKGIIPRTGLPNLRKGEKFER